MDRFRIFPDGTVDVGALAALQEPPEPWAPGEPRFWDDPHISTQMLAAHLDPDTEAASRPTEVIEDSVSWIVDRLGLQSGDRLLDLGCGPGLYARRFAARGIRVTGIDISAGSIEHARAHDPTTTYRCADYRGLDDVSAFEAVTLIYGDYCVLDDGTRRSLLSRVRRALVGGGWFVLDVSTRAHHEQDNCGDGWSAHPDGGFWRPGPHFCLNRHFSYPDLSMALDQYAIVEPGGGVTVYRNWFRYFDAESISAELTEEGFQVRGLYGDLRGSPQDPDGHWIGVVARHGEP